MKILGVNLSNNGSICVLDDGKVEFYLESERITRNKRDYIVRDLLSFVDDVDYIAFSDAFYSGKKKCLESSRDVAKIKNKFSNAEVHDFRDRHHLTHTSCGFYNSEFDEAAVIVVDSSGSQFPEGDESETIMHVKTGRRFYWKCVYKTFNFDKTFGIGFAFDNVSQRCGWGRNEAGKVMGLAPFGYYIEGDGYLNSSEENACATVQKNWEDRSVELVKIAVSKTKCNNIVLSGGCFLNCVVNYNLLKEFPDLNFYVDPIAYDGGTSIGAAYLVHHNPKIKSY